MRNVKERVYGKYGNNLTYKKELLDIVEGLGGQLLFFMHIVYMQLAIIGEKNWIFQKVAESSFYMLTILVCAMKPIKPQSIIWKTNELYRNH